MTIEQAELLSFIPTWGEKPKTQVIPEIASCIQESNRIPNCYYFLPDQDGDLFSPTAKCKVKNIIRTDTKVGYLEVQAFEKIEKWFKSSSDGVIAWISPPDPVFYPTAKIIISEICRQEEQKILFNRAIVVDLDQERSLRFAQDLASFDHNRPLLFSIDQVRATPIILNTQHSHWLGILEGFIPHVSLWNGIRVGEDLRAENKALKEAGRLYQELLEKKGQGVDLTSFLGGYSLSCPTVLGSAFNVFYEHSYLLEQTFPCPRCLGKIPSGRGITVCPHCGARKEDYEKCD